MWRHRKSRWCLLSGLSKASSAESAWVSTASLSIAMTTRHNPTLHVQNAFDHVKCSLRSPLRVMLQILLGVILCSLQICSVFPRNHVLLQFCLSSVIMDQTHRPLPRSMCLINMTQLRKNWKIKKRCGETQKWSWSNAKVVLEKFPPWPSEVSVVQH